MKPLILKLPDGTEAFFVGTEESLWRAQRTVDARASYVEAFCMRWFVIDPKFLTREQIDAITADRRWQRPDLVWN